MATSRRVAAAGKVLCPGFIDVHTHAEEIDGLPRGENFLRMGVTTLVLGNCGTSVLDVDAFFARLRPLFTDQEVLDLTFYVGRFLAFGRLTHVLGLDDSCDLGPAASEESAQIAS